MMVGQAFAEFRRLAEARAARIAKRSIYLIYEQHLIPKSPVWMGPFVSNFTFTAGAPASAPVPAVEGGERGANRSGVKDAALVQYREMIDAANVAMGKTYFITNNVPYAAEIEAFGSPKGWAQGMVAATTLIWQRVVSEAARNVK